MNAPPKTVTNYSQVIHNPSKRVNKLSKINFPLFTTANGAITYSPFSNVATSGRWSDAASQSGLVNMYVSAASQCRAMARLKKI